MDYRRFVTFLVVCFAFSYLYQNFVMPPRPVPQQLAAEPEKDADGADSEAQGADGNVVDGDDDNDAKLAESGDDPAVEATVDEGGKDPQLNKPEVPAHPEQTVELGSLDPASKFALQAVISSRGASIQSVQLTDPKFKELKNRERQVQVLGTGPGKDRTMSLAVDLIDQQLAGSGQTLETINWELISADAGEIVFGFDAPDGDLAVRKTFRLPKFKVEADSDLKAAFSNQPQGYTIETEVQLINKSDDEKKLQYELQGPVGIVLENKDHARKYRDIKLEFVDDDDPVTFTASEVDELYSDKLQEKGQLIPESELRAILRQREAWTGACRYVGTDVQFFAALISTLDDRSLEERLKDRWVERVYPVMVSRDEENVNFSSPSFRLVSVPLTLDGAGDSVSHRFGMFVGPKRQDLLEPEPFVADQVLDYGWWFGFIARVMHSILDTFHGFGMPYFLAIISLTVLVRGLMFPISRKQAVMAAKQKALAPKLNELKLKHGDDKEKMARAQMELWRKHGINPLGGCLPIFFQFPVFIALYTCLNTAVELRLAPFLWVDNLAAPDALVTMPSLPFLGSDFNLLPCITVVLFLVQQKLFMPPPADEQAEMTQKMMNFMTIGMGLMFWHVPAGLCIYFIASSLWGIAERTLLKVNVTAPPEPSVTVRAASSESDNGEPGEPKKLGFFGGLKGKLQESLQEAQRQADAQKKASENSRGADKGKSGKKKKKKR